RPGVVTGQRPLKSAKSRSAIDQLDRVGQMIFATEWLAPH
ncbi:MAG: hypothetical protein ACI97B_004656, partial [Verrucomicrobiales bacterium]